jgi:phage baseplate assembly protein W
MVMAGSLIDAFQFPLSINGGRGELKREGDYNAYVAQLIRQVLLTSQGERAHRPTFGAGLLRMVFAPNDDATASLLQTTIFQALTENLGTLITVNDVEATASDSLLAVSVTYTIKSRRDRQILNLEVAI